MWYAIFYYYHKEINQFKDLRKLTHAKLISIKLVSIKYTIYWHNNSPKFTVIVYRFCVPSSNNLSGDQDDVMMVEENVEVETNIENDFTCNITTGDVNRDNETISDSRNSERFVVNIRWNYLLINCRGQIKCNEKNIKQNVFKLRNILGQFSCNNQMQFKKICFSRNKIIA